MLRRFAEALAISPQIFGLTEQQPHPGRRHGPASGATTTYPRLPAPKVTGETRDEVGEDPVWRRQLLANLAATATAAGAPLLGGHTAQPQGEADQGDLLIGGLRDAMLGLGTENAAVPATRIRAELAGAFADFHTCRYGRLADRLPRLIRHGHILVADGAESDHTLLAEVYLLATRMLIKLDDQQLGWMAADRARTLADAGGNAFTTAEAARNLAVLARKAGWHREAMAIALAAADHLALRDGTPAADAERGLLIQSAAYTAARSGDRAGMRELTAEAEAIAARLGGVVLLRDHGGGFNLTTVHLHRISAENAVGEPGAAVAAARQVAPGSLPTTERRARYYTDLATAFGHWGRRDDCLRALLAAERHAPEEVHTRPAVRALISGLLLSGRTTLELRGLAARCGIR